MGLKFFFIAFVAYGVSGRNVEEANGNDDVVPLIVGGNTALAGEFRGKISIQFEANGTHICGGTLIDANHVLTSASCVTNSWGEVIHPSVYRLMGDDLTISVQSSNQNRQLRGASHVFVHPQYNLYTHDHNVAVIRSDVNFTVSTTFNPVSRALDSPAVNSQCSIAGWGNIFNNGPVSFQLLRMNAVVISRATCNSPTSYNGSVRGGMFCAGNVVAGQHTCQRDDGGGLICNNIIFGILSWGVECVAQHPDFPAVYTDVAIYNSWIDSARYWNEGDHEIVPTPTPITTTTPVPVPTTPISTTTTESPNGAAGTVHSIFLFLVCITMVFLK